MGMMSGVYFVGRQELLDWVNDLLGLNYAKVEDTANGAAFCQIIDVIHPGTVALGRVNFDAYLPPDMVNNYKVLQDAFNKNGIPQYIDVVTLTKGKYMAALEMFQWIHGYYVQTGPHSDYDPVARRKQFKCKEPSLDSKPGAPQSVKPAGMAKRLKPVGGVPPKTLITEQNSKPEKNVPEPVPIQKKPAPAPAPVPKKLPKEEAPPVRVPMQKETSTSVSKELIAARKQIEELQEETEQMNQERDFYYDKLRRIEEYCQENEENSTVKKILEILYETDEKNGFVAPDDE